MTCRWHHVARRPEFQRDAIPATRRILPGARNHARMEVLPEDWYNAIAQQEASLSLKHSRAGRTGLKENSCWCFSQSLSAPFPTRKCHGQQWQEEKKLSEVTNMLTVGNSCAQAQKTLNIITVKINKLLQFKHRGHSNRIFDCVYYITLEFEIYITYPLD